MISFLYSLPSFVFLLIIFFSKLIEIVLSSLKTVMLVKGQRLISTALAFLEVLLWATFVSGVISDLSSSPARVLFYCLGYTAGYFSGSMIENFLALGTMDVSFITPAIHKQDIVRYLEEQELGYFVAHCEGRTGEHVKVDVVLPRRNARDLRHHISNLCDGNVFVLNYDVAYRHGGIKNKLSRGC